MSSVSSKKVLIADDSPENLNLLKIYLSQLYSDIDTAKNGEEAVNFFKNNDGYDLVLLDINMPVMGGVEAAKLLKDQNKNTAVISISGDSESHFDHSCFDQSLQKPFNFGSLLEVISKLQ